MDEHKKARDSSNSQPEEDDIDAAHLYQLLVDHVTEQHRFGVSVDELIAFVNDAGTLTKFFESRGHNLRTSSSDRSVSKEEENRTGNVSGCGVGVVPSRFSKVLRVTVYLTLFTVVSVIGHVSICHLLDVNPLKYLPSLQEKRCLLPAHPILMEMTRPIAECGFCGNGKSPVNSGDDANDGKGIVIEMKEAPGKSEFAKVAYLSKPVIIRGGGKGGGMPEGFDFDKLKNIFQSEPGGVDAVSEECQFLPFRSPFTSLREAFDKISENSSWDDPWYIGWSNCHPGVAAKLRELFPRPNFLPEDSSSSAIDWIFIGSPGLGASMHVRSDIYINDDEIDYVKRPSWQAQLSGVKRWILHPPPECESVCPESVTFTIYPGDLLFLETNTWYHETFIDSDSFSISIGSEYD